ncbi:MAG: hypothetical protein ACO29O_06015, partial [Chitinophagaceae bacterium]
MKFFFVGALLLTFLYGDAQKKILDHTVYDGWQSIGERKISNDGQWLAFSVDPQEGDGDMYIRKTDGSNKVDIVRGYQGSFSIDNKFFYTLIKPLYTDIREARIKKKKNEDFPKDSLLFLDLQKMVVEKFSNVKTYLLPSKSSNAIAIHFAKENDTALKKNDINDEGGKVIVINTVNGHKREFSHISELKWSDNGKLLAMEYRSYRKDSTSKSGILLYRAFEEKVDTIAHGGNEFMNLAFDETASQMVFTAERDSTKSSIQKFHKLWYWKNGMDTAIMLLDKNAVGMRLNWSVSPNARNYFNKKGDRLFLGTTPVRAPADTSLPEIDRVKLDIWHYNDDIIQPAQLVNLENELKRSYLAVYDLSFSRLIQLADENLSEIITGEGLGNYYIGISEQGKKIESQWTGSVLKDIYAIDARDGKRILIKKDLLGNPYLSGNENFIFWYDKLKKNYFTWFNNSLVNISAKLTKPLWDEDNDVPEEPMPYGFAGWLLNDVSFLVYDRYDIWKLDPFGKKNPDCITQGLGRKSHVKFRYIETDPEAKTIDTTRLLWIKSHNEISKESGIYSLLIKLNPIFDFLNLARSYLV